VATPDDVLNQARSHLGYKEGPNNATVFGTRTGFPNQPWCGSYVSCCFADAGQHGEPSSIYTPAGAAAYKRMGFGRWISRNGPAEPGDVVYFDWSGSENVAATDHVGFVEAVLPDGRVQTIEGNTSPSTAGSQSDGGGVYRRVRSRNNIVGFGRPAYSGKPAPAMSDADRKAFRKYAAAVLKRDLAGLPMLRQGMSGGRIQQLQNALNVVAGKQLQADGVFGQMTAQAVRDLQRVMKLEVDGIVGPKTLDAIMFLLSQVEANG